MSAREYLISIQHLDIQIDIKLAQARRWREIAERATTVMSLTKVEGGPDNGGRMGCIERAIDAEREVDAMVDELVDKKREAQVALSNMAKHEERMVLESRYLNGKEWKDIAKAMDYSEAHVYRLHNDAIVNFRVPVKDESK